MYEKVLSGKELMLQAVLFQALERSLRGTLYSRANFTNNSSNMQLPREHVSNSDSKNFHTDISILIEERISVRSELMEWEMLSIVAFISALSVGPIVN